MEPSRAASSGIAFFFFSSHHISHQSPPQPPHIPHTQNGSLPKSNEKHCVCSFRALLGTRVLGMDSDIHTTLYTQLIPFSYMRSHRQLHSFESPSRHLSLQPLFALCLQKSLWEGQPREHLPIDLPSRDSRGKPPPRVPCQSRVQAFRPSCDGISRVLSIGFSCCFSSP